MKTNILKVLLLAFSVFFVGCAASYKPINPSSIKYDSHRLNDGVSLSYKYDVLREKGNRKYANKEDKKNIRIVAVKLTNNTDSTVNTGDLSFYSSYSQVILMDPMTIKNTIKQIVPSYLPYLLLTFVNLYVTKVEDGIANTDTYPIGLVMGPGITIGNLAVAATANESMLREMNFYNIHNRDIPKGETIYGIIGIRDGGYRPLSVKLKRDE